MRTLFPILLTLCTSTTASAAEPTEEDGPATYVELHLGAALASVWHYTQDGVYGGLSQEADYQIPGPAVGLRLMRDTSVPWLSISGGLRGSVMEPTTDYLSGTTTVEVGPDDPAVDIEHDHQTEILLQYVTLDAAAYFHLNPGPVRFGLTLGPGVRILDVQRETFDTCFLPTSTEEVKRSYGGVRVQSYLVLGLRGSVEVSDGVRLGLDLGIDPSPVDLRLWESFDQVRNPDTGETSLSWDTKADLSGPMPRAALLLAVSL